MERFNEQERVHLQEQPCNHSSSGIELFLSHLQHLAINIEVVGDRLLVDASKGTLSNELRAALQARKAEVLAFYRQQQSTRIETSHYPSNGAANGYHPIPPVTAAKEQPKRCYASFAQQRMWFLDQLTENKSHLYNIPLFLRASGELHLPILLQTVNEIVRRHEALRTFFQPPQGDDKEPYQSVLPSLTVDAPLIDLSEWAAQKELAEKEKQLQLLARQEAETPFDLANGPLIRLRIIKVGDQDHLLLFHFHHTIFDGLSVSIFLREVKTLYTAFLQGEPSPLPPLAIQYPDFSQWQRTMLTEQGLTGPGLQEQLAFWRSHLAGAPPFIELPTNHPRPANQTFKGARFRFVIDSEQTKALRTVSRDQQTTLFMTLYAAFATLLARYSNQEDFVIGVPVANRNHPQLESLIGLFVNTLALRCPVDPSKRFCDLLQQVKTTTLQAYRHQDLPFEQLINELNVERSLSYNPLFQVMFSFQAAHTAGFALPGLTVAPFPFEESVAKFDLTLILHEAPDHLAGCMEYNSDLFDRAMIERMIGHFQVLLQGIVADPATPLAQLPLLPEEEKEYLISSLNQTATPYPQEYCFQQLFEAQAARTPQAVAAVCGAEQISYADLNRRSNRWAWQLLEAGIQPGDIVALAAERSIDYLTAFLAILKAGAVYMPCDPTYPAERLKQILQQSQATLVLTEQSSLPLFIQMEGVSAKRSTPCPFLSLAALAQRAGREDTLPLRCRPQDVAYVIFTSGSTGTPKGALVHHQGMLNHLYAMIRELDLTSADRIAQTAPQMFDISIWQFLVASLVGGTVHILDQTIAGDPTKLLAVLEQQAITILEVVPSLLRVMLEMIEEEALPAAYFKTLRWLIPTGEALPPDLARHWFSQYPTIPLLNAYGPAECSDDVTCYPLYTAPAESLINLPIGRPVANMRVYILNAHRQLLPMGIPGELYIGGVGVGLGYLHDAERTRQAFLPDPFANEAGARLYKTGDLARWVSIDGCPQLEYLGRVDFQVKIRGFRIELGEIEAVLRQHPAVQEAVALAHTDEGAEKQLVAYVTLSQPLNDSLTVLRAWLKAHLPDYMIPSTMMLVDKLPLTPNGKIDRKALPKPAQIRPQERYRPPRDSIELRLVQCWEKLLALSPLSVQDNFFEIGGDSLLAIRLVSNIQQEFGVKLPLQTLFQSTTIEQLAGLLRQQAVPAAWSPLVCLQPKGEKTPLFFVHAAGGIVFRYLQVAALLGKERPFYGLQARGIEPGDTFYASIEEMAADYVAAIRHVQPQGPYLVAGWSFGGTVAFEMARLLEEAGETVPLLLMVDAPSPFIDSFAEDDVEFLVERLRPAAGLTLDQLEFQTSQEAKLAYLFQEQRLAGLFAPDIDDDYARHRLNLHKHHNQIICDYRPTGSIQGRIIFYKPSEAIPFDTRMKEPTVDWLHFALGGVEVHDAPGNHFNMFSTVNSPVLAEKLKAAIEQFDTLLPIKG